jgi:hypothetical protein
MHEKKHTHTGQKTTCSDMSLLFHIHRNGLTRDVRRHTQYRTWCDAVGQTWVHGTSRTHLAAGAVKNWASPDDDRAIERERSIAYLREKDMRERMVASISA